MRNVMDIGAKRPSAVGGRLAIAVVGLTMTFGFGDAQAAFPGGNGRIAVAVEKWRTPDTCRGDVPHSCEPEVYSSTLETVLPSGRGRRVLRAWPGAGGPVWSPSGKLLTFQQGSRLAIMRHDGTVLRRLPQLTSGDGAPTWSPHGGRLAFTGSSICCNWLYTVRTDGTGLRRVIAQEALMPAWSVTGTIAFVNNTGRRPEYSRLKAGLYTIRPDGSRRRRLLGRTGKPDWSPDGSRIAFSRGHDIFTIRADGRGLRRLTTAASERTRTSGAAWSPDGRYIAFIRDGDLYVMRSDGRGLRRVIDARQQSLEHPDRPWAEVSAPSWQPLPR
jgi:Tol biopolymer transport system component